MLRNVFENLDKILNQESTIRISDSLVADQEIEFVNINKSKQKLIFIPKGSIDDVIAKTAVL